MEAQKAICGRKKIIIILTKFLKKPLDIFKSV